MFPWLSALGMCAATGNRLGLAPVHKEVTKKINSELVPVCFQIQEDKDMNKISLRATILPALGSKKQEDEGCMGQCSVVSGDHLQGLQPLGSTSTPWLEFSFHRPPFRHPVLAATPGDGRCGSTPFSASSSWVT